VWLIVAGLAIALFVRSRKPARSLDLLFWILSVPLAIAVTKAGNAIFGRLSMESSQAFFLRQQVLILGFVAFSGFLVTMIRLVGRLTRPQVLLLLGGLALAAVLSFFWVIALSSAPIVGRRFQCKDRIWKVGLGLNDHASKTGQLPSPTIGDGSVARSWRVELLPWMSPHDRAGYDDQQPWDAATNSDFAATTGAFYSCPIDPDPRDDKRRFFTAYALPTGPMTAFADPSRAANPDFPDGASHTLLVIEACGQRIVWTEPRDIDVPSAEPGINRPGASPGRSDGLISSYHAGGAHVALADGAVRWISEGIDPAVLKALVTADGGEPEPKF
jgi:hypothetical protein